MPEDILDTVAGFTRTELEAFAGELEASIVSERFRSLIANATTDDGLRKLASRCWEIDEVHLGAEVAVILLVRRGIKAAETFITHLD